MWGGEHEAVPRLAFRPDVSGAGAAEATFVQVLLTLRQWTSVQDQLPSREPFILK